MKFNKLSNLPLPALVALALAAMVGVQYLAELYVMTPLAEDTVRLKKLATSRPGLFAKQSTVKSTVTNRLEEILSRLGQQKSTAVRIEKLHQIAEDNAVVIRKAGYRNVAMPGGITRHEMQAELAGSYPDIRRFLRALLAQDEAIAVDAIEFNRPPGIVGVHTQVRLTLYLRQGTP